jgi:hypothetical protein
MKTVFFIFFIFFIFLIFFHTPVATADGEYFRAVFMPLEAAQKKWPSKIFSAIEFKTGSPATRAKMAVSAIKSQIFKGDGILSVREKLGTPDGYFFNDTVLAYQIELWTEAKKESWQLVFVPDEQNKVKEVKIHKKCCYQEPVWPKDG